MVSLEVSQALDIMNQDNSKKNATSFFLETINRLQEIIHSEEGWSSGNMLKYEEDIKFLNYLVTDFFPNIRYTLSSGSIKSVEGAVMSILAVIDLSKNLFDEGADRVLPKHVLNNAVENIFSQVTMRYQKPDAVQFQRALKSISISTYDKPIKGSSYKFESSLNDPKIDFLDSLKNYLEETKSTEKTAMIHDDRQAVIMIDLLEYISDDFLFPKEINRVGFHKNMAILIQNNISLASECEECFKNFQLVSNDDGTCQLFMFQEDFSAS